MTERTPAEGRGRRGGETLRDTVSGLAEANRGLSTRLRDALGRMDRVLDNQEQQAAEIRDLHERISQLEIWKARHAEDAKVLEGMAPALQKLTEMVTDISGWVETKRFLKQARKRFAILFVGLSGLVAAGATVLHFLNEARNYWKGP